jgi:hypothetical protein
MHAFSYNLIVSSKSVILLQAAVSEAKNGMHAARVKLEASETSAKLLTAQLSEKDKVLSESAFEVKRLEQDVQRYHTIVHSLQSSFQQLESQLGRHAELAKEASEALENEKQRSKLEAKEFSCKVANLLSVLNQMKQELEKHESASASQLLLQDKQRLERELVELKDLNTTAAALAPQYFMSDVSKFLSLQLQRTTISDSAVEALRSQVNFLLLCFH